MASRPIWYELMAADPAPVVPFYRAALGWDIPASGAPMPNGGTYRMIGRADGGNAGGLFTLTPGMLDAGARPGWFSYFHVADVDAAVAQAVALGGAVMMPAWSAEPGRMAMVTDPHGAPFYLMCPNPPPGQPDAVSDVFDTDRPGHCRWNELQTPDEPAATAFYTTLLGWTAENAMPMGDRGEYRFVECDGVAIGAINPWMAEGTRPGWLPYFGVTDIDAARGAAAAHGGTIVQDVHQVPGDDWIFIAIDPAGATVGFVGPKAEA